MSQSASASTDQTSTGDWQGRDFVVVANQDAPDGGQAIAAGNAETLGEVTAPLHESEMGDLLATLEPAERQELVALLGESFDYSALTEVDEAIRLEIITVLPNEQIALALQELESDDAVYILEDMDESEQADILARIPFTERIRLRRSLDEFVVDGVDTTLPLFRTLVRNQDMLNGDYNIHWLEEFLGLK